jgi:glucose/arabinose dehydrogenase
MAVPLFALLLVSVLGNVRPLFAQTARPTPEQAASKTGDPSGPPEGFGPVVLETAPGLAALSFDDYATNLVSPEDGSGHLFLTLKRGQVRVIGNLPRALPPPVFLDISRRVNAQGLEEGLLGLAFDPMYRTNGSFYVSYTASHPRRLVVSRFLVSHDNPLRADRRSALVLIEIPLYDAPGFAYHNGGQLAFGPDGHLYIAVGDGGVPEYAQDLSELAGKVLRIDVRDATPDEPYRGPPDNPFAQAAGTPETVRPEVWAYGLRNPWRMSFDPVTGNLWAADVGESDYEEVNLIKPGRNYGWPMLEGLECLGHGGYNCAADVLSGLEPPIAVHSREDGWVAIIGGYVYRGARLPWLSGAYVYGDLSGRIWALWFDGARVTQQRELAQTGLLITTFGLDLSGELYIVSSPPTSGIYLLSPGTSEPDG